MTAVTSPACAAPGDLDPFFGQGGKVVTSFGGTRNEALALAIQRDGKVVAAGVTSGQFNSRAFAVARYTPGGGPDPSFGTAGMVITSFGALGSGQAQALAIQSDGKIVAAGWTGFGLLGPPAFHVARYTPEGALDRHFGVAGQVTTAFGHGVAAATTVAIQKDGRILVAGFAGHPGVEHFALARYRTNGRLDTSFGVGGLVTTALGDQDRVFALAIQTDSKIVVAGVSTVNHHAAFALARYRKTGRMDATFGGADSGTVRTAFIPFDAAATAVAIRPDGRIVVGGTASQFFADTARAVLARYTPEGAPDTSFGAAGTVFGAFGSASEISALAIEPDGRIVVAGNMLQQQLGSFAVARFHERGSLDPDFGGDGWVVTEFGWESFAFAVALYPDGKIVAAGTVRDVNGNSRFAVARYLVRELPPPMGLATPHRRRIRARRACRTVEAGNGAGAARSGNNHVPE
jgi:uncharacterized delta-60 repeat protein